jgi:UDP-N-acetyl-D-mannosaminuronate dehydrogenase
MKIVVVGTGYVGLVSGTCLAETGNNVICVDVDDEGKVAAQSIATTHFLPGIKENKYTFVKIVSLPLEGTKQDKDITDYFIKRGFKINEFIALWTCRCANVFIHICACMRTKAPSTRTFSTRTS